MALYSRPDYYVKTFTARNCSRKIENAALPIRLSKAAWGPLRPAGKWRDAYPLPGNQSKMHACFAHVHAFSKSLI